MRRNAATRAETYGAGATPFGWAAVVCGPRGVVEIMTEKDAETLRRHLVERYPGLPEEAGGLCAAALGQLQDYFAGRRRSFDLPLDLEGMSPFATAVLTALQRVPVGETVSYGELAARAGHPGAGRAVGRVMAGNPLPLLIPCHRVVGAGGAMTGYSGAGGVATKEWLLAFEQRSA